MATINTAPTSELHATYGALIKYIKQYIEVGALKSKFDFFESEEITKGNGFEIDLILSADGKNEKQSEHGTYKPNVMCVVSKENVKKQYAVTVDETEIEKCVGDDGKLQQYAMKLTESLFQGWIDDKNKSVYDAIKNIYDSAQSVTFATEASTQETARNMMVAIKAKIGDFFEGVTGESYGNTYIGAKHIACDRIAIIVSNATKAMLDVYGYATMFNKEFAEFGVEIISTNRMEDNVALITDARNIQVHKWKERVKEIENSDFSHNVFLNVLYRVDFMKDNSGVIAFPCAKVVSAE